MQITHKPIARSLLNAILITTAAWAGSVLADGNKAPPPAAYIAECGSCHAPFAAKLLPAASWRAIMNSLDKHYGTDASIDAPTLKALTDWLAVNPSTKIRTRPPEDRITKSTYFAQKHREVTPAVWARPAIKSALNCTACHTRAAEGSYSEREIVIPK